MSTQTSAASYLLHVNAEGSGRPGLTSRAFSTGTCHGCPSPGVGEGHSVTRASGPMRSR